MIPPQHIVLSGGGIRVISLLGSLRALEKHGSLCKVKQVCGVSAGAFLGFLMATGYPLEKIERLVLHIDFGIIRSVNPEAFLEFPERFGIDDGSAFVKFLESIFRVALKLDPKITLGDFAALKRPGQIGFRCWATDLNTTGIREFSSLKTPSVRVIDALRASMALPFYFTPHLDPITGHMLTDGGVQGGLPLHHLTDEECEDSLSLGFSYGAPKVLGELPQDLMGFVNSLFSSLIHSRHEDCLRKWAHKIIYIPCKEYPSWNFEASREDREMLLKKGSDATEAWLLRADSGSRKIKRRSSI
jgi:predicted acylesterase/phospholipase RssA